jgi:hypothetical protein
MNCSGGRISGCNDPSRRRSHGRGWGKREHYSEHGIRAAMALCSFIRSDKLDAVLESESQKLPGPGPPVNEGNLFPLGVRGPAKIRPRNVYRPAKSKTALGVEAAGPRGARAGGREKPWAG